MGWEAVKDSGANAVCVEVRWERGGAGSSYFCRAGLQVSHQSSYGTCSAPDRLAGQVRDDSVDALNATI